MQRQVQSPLESIRTLPTEVLELTESTYHRFHGINQDVVARYAKLIKRGETFPPVLVFFDGKENRYWVADGFCRAHAHVSAGLAEIRCDVRFGGKRDAALAGVSRLHGGPGQRATNLDKRASVTNILNDPELRSWSDREIAILCKVTQPFVSKIRKELFDHATHAPMSDSKESISQKISTNLQAALKHLRSLEWESSRLEPRQREVLLALEKYFAEPGRQSSRVCWEVVEIDEAQDRKSVA